MTPDKTIWVMWDPEPEAGIKYALQWFEVNGSHETFRGFYSTAQTKVDIVSVFKIYQVPSGWYHIKVIAVNTVLLSSIPANATNFFWRP